MKFVFNNSIRCDTQAKANFLFKIFRMSGVRWIADVKSMTETSWHKYMENTAYFPNRGLNELQFGKNRFNSISLSEFIKQQQF